MRARFGRDGTLRTGGLVARGREGGVGELHYVTRLQRMMGDPDAPTVHPRAAPVDHGLGSTAGNAQPRRKEILQRLARIGLADNAAFEIGAVTHRHTRMMEPTTPTVFLP